MSLIVQFSTDNNIIRVQFDQTPKVASITNANFILTLNAATPIVISDPFKLLDPYKDYDSVGRLLYLTLSQALQSGDSHTLRVTGLLNAAGQLIPDSTWDFISPTFPTAFTVDQLPPNPQPVDIEDRSIFETPFISGQSLTIVNPNFYIVSTDPDLDNPFIPVDYNNGRVSISFSTYPAGKYITPQYIKVQSKQVVDEPGPSFFKWKNVPVHFSMDHDNPILYLDFPSNDASPVYYSSGHTYFQSGFKYRIKISKLVGTA